MQHSRFLFVDIIKDLFLKNKLVMFLILLLIITTLSTIWLTNTTRLLVNEKNNLVKQQQKLEYELVNLKLEETIFSNEARIKKISKQQLNMHPILFENENIILK